VAKNKSEPQAVKPAGSPAGRSKRAHPSKARANAALARSLAESARAKSKSETAQEHDESEGPEQEASDATADEPELIEAVGEVVDVDVVEDQDAGLDLSIPWERVRPQPGKHPMVSTPVASGAALSRLDPMAAYLHEVQRHPLLTPDEEKSLTLHYAKTGDVKAAARLVTANLRLVVKLAYGYRLAYKNIMDLIQEGNIGLMQAVKRYDPYRGVKLSSYAAWWIRAYILRFILNNARLVKLGTTQAQRKLFFNLNKEKAKLAAMGIEPSAAEIARRLNVDEKEVIDMDRRLSGGDQSLDAPSAALEGRGMPRVELLPSAQVNPEMALQASEMDTILKDRLEQFRKTLKGKDAIIFDRRMTAEEPLTLQELGNEFGVSRERVRQLEARLIGKLRIYLKEELGESADVEG
jgi:RNA polymerase sigma-32 factor